MLTQFQVVLFRMGDQAGGGGVVGDHTPTPHRRKHRCSTSAGRVLVTSDGQISTYAWKLLLWHDLESDVKIQTTSFHPLRGGIWECFSVLKCIEYCTCWVCGREGIKAAPCGEMAPSAALYNATLAVRRPTLMKHSMYTQVFLPDDHIGVGGKSWCRRTSKRVATIHEGMEMTHYRMNGDTERFNMRGNG